MIHIPVLQKEIIKYLNPKPNENFMDATFGLGGHTKEILKRNGPYGKVLAIELDPELKGLSKDSPRTVLVNDSYVNLRKIVEKYNFKPIHGILFDLGLSSWHLEESGRGFSFQKDEPLDMRYNPKSPLRAGDIINQWKEKEIEKILREYSEERFAKRIARRIVETRKKNPIKTTFQLVEIIGGRHFARRTFQALRIAVNDELENLKKALPQALEVLGNEGRIVIISFHSLEDRIVKNFFRENAKKGLCQILTKKPIRPSLGEIQKNLRSSEAKLRAIKKI